MSNDESTAKDKAIFFSKMSRITGEIISLEKTSTNQFHKYKYTSAEKVLGALAPLMARENIALISEMVSVEVNDKVYIPHYVFTFVCGDTGYMHPCSWYGEIVHTSNKGTRDDKALNKAATISQKYFLLKTFLIATDDDPDGAQGNTKQRGNGGTKPSQAPAPEVQPAEVSWPSKNTVAVVMDWYRSKNISDPEIFKLARVTAIDDGDGWRKYADAKAAINGIQDAFDAELAGKATPQDNGRQEVYSCLFTHQAYVVNGTSKYLVFANCDPSNSSEDFKPTTIRAYGRSTTVKSWLGDFVYEENKLAQYGNAKKTTHWTPMAIPVEFEYEQRTPEKGDKFLEATGIVGGDANF